MNASNTQVGGDHYTAMGDYQPWDVLQHWLTPEEYRGYQKGVIIAYLAREKAKGGDQDIRKAAHHLQKLCEVIGDARGLIEPAPTAPDTNRELHWIDWNGGKRPVNHNQHVVIQTKNGNHEEGQAEDFYWQHFGSRFDIIKYAVVK